MQLFDITLDNLSRDDALKRFLAWLSGTSFQRIATVNPEFLLLANEDQQFFSCLHQADYRVVDGFGIVIVGWLSRLQLTRFPGVDLMEVLLGSAEKNGDSVFVAIKKDGLSSYGEIRAALKIQYPRLTVEGRDIDVKHLDALKNDVLAHVHASRANILFCNFGAPEQEYFVESFRENPGSIRLAMGVGGSFDYLTGKIVRAPHCLRAVGLEWLWRLIQQPKRFGRIWSATIVFLWRSMLNK